MVTLIVLVCLTAGMGMWVWMRRRPTTPAEDALRALPTGLPTIPLLGHLHYLLYRTDIQTKYAEFLLRIASYGHDTYCMWVGRRPWVFLNRPEDIQVVLNSSKSLEKTGEYNLLKFAAGDGLLTCSVSRWKMTRGPMQSMVHPRNLDHLVPGMNQRCQALAGRLAAAGDRGPFDIFPTMYDFALRNVMNLAFGPNVELDMDSKEFRIIRDATVSGFHLFAKRLLTRWLHWESFFRFLYSKRIQAIDNVWNAVPIEIKKAIARFDSPFIKDEVDKISLDKKQDYSSDPVTVVDAYLSIIKQYPQITKEDFLNEAKTTIAGGSDTVATALSSCLLALAAHPPVQERLYAEIVEVVGAEAGIVTSDDIRNLPYLDCVVKESMRRFTVIPMVLRKNDEEIKLRDCTLPPKTKIVVNILGQNMNAKLYPEPEKFDPERFAPENTAQRDRYTYIPFCAGPRDCIGKPYALLFIKIAVVTLLRQFVLSTPDDINQLKFRFETVLVSTTGYNILFNQRLGCTNMKNSL